MSVFYSLARYMLNTISKSPLVPILTMKNTENSTVNYQIYGSKYINEILLSFSTKKRDTNIG